MFRSESNNAWLVRVASACSAAVVSTTALGGGVQITPFGEEAVERGVVFKVADYNSSGGVAYGHAGYGVGFVDLDGDHDNDLVLLGGGGTAPDGSDRVPSVFENIGNGMFVDRTPGSGLGPQLEMVGFAAGDYDADGDLDLFITNLPSLDLDGELAQENTLYRNDGGFTFTDVTAEAGVGGGRGDSNGAAWGDFNGDGWLDLHVANYNGISGVPGSKLVDNQLWLNNQDGTFTEVAEAQGVNSSALSFLGTLFDMDRDGDLDLYISNDRGHLPPPFGAGPNELYRNDNGQFVDISEGSGADLGLFSMGVACGDFDANGYPDLYCTNIGGYAEGFNPLLLNQGNETFIEFSDPAGVDQYITSWGTVFFDFDNDADLDLYVNNQFKPNALHLNPAQAWPCIDVAGLAGVQSQWPQIDDPPGPIKVSYTSAVGDADGDGDLDLLCGTLSQNIELFVNYEGNERNSVRLEVVGEWPNLFAIGANAELTVGGAAQFHEVYAGGNGYLGQNELVMHFGVGNAPQGDQAVVNWPGGAVQRTLVNIPAGTQWLVYPPSALGDANGDGTVVEADFGSFAMCYAAPSFETGCEVHDFTGDFIIDDDDFAAFLGVYTGALGDCDDNGVMDLEQILASGGDADGDGVLDGCDVPGDCVGDLDGSGAVDSSDLNMVLVGFGCVGGACTGDVDGDGDTDSSDLNALLAAFGDGCE